jgi:hypothetical protein
MTEAQQKRGRGWRWFWGFTFLFLAHAAAVFWFGQPLLPPTPPDQPKPLIYLATDDASAARVADLAGIDPTLFAWPSEKGFSGNAWLKPTPPDMTVTNWSAQPNWLPLNTNELGATLLVNAKTNRISTEPLLDGLRGGTPFELRIAAAPLVARSTLAIEGSVKARPFTVPVPLPSATNVDLLTNTVVEIAVNGDGIVESIMLSGECGSKTADEAALAVARQIAFSALPLKRAAREAAVPQRGRVIFTWHIVPPAITNGLTATAPRRDQ